MKFELLFGVIAVYVTVTAKVGCQEVDDPSAEISIQWISRDLDVPRTYDHRIRRAAASSGSTKNSLTQADRIQFLSAHNTMRRLVSATNMLKMVWNGGLESMAQQWANQCNFQHGQPARTSKPFNPIGQNLYASTGANYNVTVAVLSWYNEVQYYTYATMSCTPQQQCGHYTQVVWAQSYAIGCGITLCPSLGSTQMSNAYYVVCNYGPAGNYVGTKPYQNGTIRCSACPSDKPSCDGGLCRADNECSVITECTPSDQTTCLCDASYYDSSVPSGVTSSKATPATTLLVVATVVMVNAMTSRNVN